MALALNLLTLTLSSDSYPGPYQLSLCPLKIYANNVNIYPAQASVAGGRFLIVHHCCGPMSTKWWVDASQTCTWSPSFLANSWARHFSPRWAYADGRFWRAKPSTWISPVLCSRYLVPGPLGQTLRAGSQQLLVWAYQARSGQLGFVLEHEKGWGENLTFCNLREKILLASDLEEDLEAIWRGSTEPRESKLNNWTHSYYSWISFHSHNYLLLTWGPENILHWVWKGWNALATTGVGNLIPPAIQVRIQSFTQQGHRALLMTQLCALGTSVPRTEN